ncbi:protein mab-21-like 3 isoform X2 [Hyla sarda]|uniref:protein mab-21-like 3 isoform X2 n=1 Tax=Hyla sarda TaxID=327740 RepID=UPI0024C2C4E9|nr:protein mab-21-like 3 isoform X2 [Hyla sarda]
MKGITDEELHNLLINTGDVRHRCVSRMVEEVQTVMLKLTTQISSWDSRFNSISNSGIHSDNLKVLAPSQLLVTVPLRGLSGYRQKSSRRWRYYTPSGVQLLSPVVEPEKLHQWLEVEQFQKSSAHWHDTDVSIQGDLVPARVLSVLQGLLQRAIPACNLTDRVSVLESIGSTIRVTVETFGQMVEVELLPVVEIPGCWSRKARWPRFFKRWPSKERARCVKSFGFDLIARTNYHWQLSFLRAERLLLDDIDEDGGCRMKCLRVVRQLKEDVWCPGSRPVITSQHLQMILLWECERNPSSKAWLNFGSSFLRLVRRLLKCSRQRFLRHYFVRRANLLKYADANQLDKLADKLRRFLQCPTLNLSPYCDHTSIC